MTDTRLQNIADIADTVTLLIFAVTLVWCLTAIWRQERKFRQKTSLAEINERSAGALALEEQLQELNEEEYQKLLELIPTVFETQEASNRNAEEVTKQAVETATAHMKQSREEGQ